VAARCGTVAVPENPAAPSGRKLDLYVVVVPALEQPAAPDAFAYLAGGPGDAATGAVGEVEGAWKGIHVRHDMLFVDQRGTGRSNDLVCTAPARQVATLNGLQHYLGACIERLGDNPVWYGTRYAMDDLDAVRAALATAASISTAPPTAQPRRRSSWRSIGAPCAR
jgi:pimeloyl-ACP methyl ester carboxylesterase